MKCTSEGHAKQDGKSEMPGNLPGCDRKDSVFEESRITAVELMPVHEFPIRDIYGNVKDRPNYWGYESVGVLRTTPRLCPFQYAWGSGD